MLKYILCLLFLVPVSSFCQGNSVLKKKAVVFIDHLKKNGGIPFTSNDTLIDLNKDGYIDILVEYYGASGTGLKNRIQVYLYHPSVKKFKECNQLSNLANPTFYFSKKTVAGYYVANGGGYAAKLRWRNYFQLDTMEYINIDAVYDGNKLIGFKLDSYNYATGKRKVENLEAMRLPKEYRYYDYVPIIKRRE